MFIRCGAAAAALLLATSTSHAQHGASAQNMALLGHHDLQGRSAYQPFVKESRGRWIAYVVSGVPDWRVRRMTQVFDLSDPANPRFIRNFGLVGQQPGASGAAPTELHGIISTGQKRNRLFFGYGTNKSGVLQIVDRQKLISGSAEPTPANLLAPEVGRFDMNVNNGAH